MSPTVDSFGNLPTRNPVSGLNEYINTQLIIQRFHCPDLPIATPLLSIKVSVFYSLADTIERYGTHNNKGEKREFNTFYQKVMTVGGVCELIKSEKLKPETEGLRAIPRDSPENKPYKSMHFSFVCWSSTLSYKSDKSIIKHSELICVDVDRLDSDLDRVLKLVHADPMTLICFVSPNGDGLKVVYAVDPDQHSQKEWYTLLSGRLDRLADLPPKKVDPSCYEVSRACFLPSDPNLFLRLI